MSVKIVMMWSFMETMDGAGKINSQTFLGGHFYFVNFLVWQHTSLKETCSKKIDACSKIESRTIFIGDFLCRKLLKYVLSTVHPNNETPYSPFQAQTHHFKTPNLNCRTPVSNFQLLTQNKNTYLVLYHKGNPFQIPAIIQDNNNTLRL